MVERDHSGDERTLDPETFFSPDVRKAHELLGVKPGDPHEKIRDTYHKLAQLTHPDQNPDRKDAARAFQKLNEAYEIVTDPERIRELNQAYLRSVNGRLTIGGRSFDAGSFYGIRRFTRSDLSHETARQLLSGTSSTNGNCFSDQRRSLVRRRNRYIEEESAILDEPEWDLIEILLGGRFREEDVRIARRSFHRGGLSALDETPWVLKNFDGYRCFMAGDFLTAAEIYREVNERIPSNIIFLYREGLSLEAWAWHRIWNRDDSFSSVHGTLRTSLKRYQEALDIRSGRPPAEQPQAFSIRKSLADLCEALGYRRKARQHWKQVLDANPSSIEGREKERRLRPVRFYLRKAGRLLSS